MKKKVSRKFFGGPSGDMSTASAGRAMPQPGIGMGKGRGMEMRNANAMPGSRPGGTLPPVPSTAPTGVMPTLSAGAPINPDGRVLATSTGVSGPSQVGVSYPAPTGMLGTSYPTLAYKKGGAVKNGKSKLPMKQAPAVAAKKAPKFASGGSLRGYGISKKIKPSGPMC